MILRAIADIATDILDLVYPRLCAACGEEHPPRQGILCPGCQLSLPWTDFHTVRENQVFHRLYGHFPLESGTAMLYFFKDGPVQKILHRIKYQGDKEAAFSLGKYYGSIIASTPIGRSLQDIIPVPLHRSRMHKRGYNQSAWFARGLATALPGVTVREDILLRVKSTRSQTLRGRAERLVNMEGAFVLTDQTVLADRHVLLVDDVMTTGATLESCAAVLLGVPGLRISIATIAIAQNQ